ncbi:MAG: cupin domain-containing protein [Burkholderiales bacterium]
MKTASASAPDSVAVTRNWASRGFSCEIWTDSPGQVWADFVHATDELVMPIEGEVEFEIAGKLHRPKSGQELLIPANARHTVRNVGTTVSRWFYGYRTAG